MAGRRKGPFKGWTMVGVGLTCYGFGVSPGYYSWGFFAPEVMADIGLTREQVGQIFGAFTLTFAVAGPTAAWSIQRWGLRATVTAGALVAALLVTLLVAGLQWQAASKLEVQVASLETELAESQLEVRAHEARMSEVRGAVSGLAQRVEHLQTLVRRPLPKGP